MKKMVFRFIYAVLGLVLMVSCLDTLDESRIPTFEEEQALLSVYLDTLHGRGNDVDTTDLGIYYVILEEGEGLFPKEGDTLKVKYDGYFIDGYLFDSSSSNQEDSTFSFVLGHPPLIDGWDDGMKIANKNAKVQLIIPSQFAYGQAGSGIIPPYKTLIFLIEMKGIKPS